MLRARFLMGPGFQHRWSVTQAFVWLVLEVLWNEDSDLYFPWVPMRNPGICSTKLASAFEAEKHQAALIPLAL